MHGKKRREAMPEAIRSSARKSTASKSNVSTTAPVATRIPTSVATTPFIKTSKRKREDEEEEDEIKKQKTHHLTEKRAEKRKRTEEDSVDEKTNSPARETKKLRSTTSKSKMAKNYDEKTDDSIVEVVSEVKSLFALPYFVAYSSILNRSRPDPLPMPKRPRSEHLVALSPPFRQASEILSTLRTSAPSTHAAMKRLMS